MEKRRRRARARTRTCVLPYGGSVGAAALFVRTFVFWRCLCTVRAFFIWIILYACPNSDLKGYMYWTTSPWGPASTRNSYHYSAGAWGDIQHTNRGASRDEGDRVFYKVPGNQGARGMTKDADAVKNG